MQKVGYSKANLLHIFFQRNAGHDEDYCRAPVKVVG